MRAGPPPSGEAPPVRIAALAAGRPTRPVWRNQSGGTTFEISAGTGSWFAKWAPAASSDDLAAETARLRWAGRFAAVPTVLDQGRDADGAWLLTAGLPGENPVSGQWAGDASTAVVGIARGLRVLHDALPVAACPFSWSAEGRLLALRRLHAAGRLDPADWHPVHGPLQPAEAFARVADPPPVEEPVVCHGDPCVPNTLLDPAGRCVGHVDLGALGVADRWADLAVATWSVEWNYGPGWERAFLDAYGVDPDPVRTGYYRLLYDLCP